MRRNWIMMDKLAISLKGTMKEAELDLSQLFPQWEELNIGQKSAVFYGVKQIVMDSPKFSFVETFNALCSGKLNKLLRKATTTKIDVRPLIDAYNKADNDADKAMYRTALETLETLGILK
jgi:hypothetical protein